MALETAAGLGPVMGFAAVGVAGVGAQWLAWRFKMPAIVIMLVVGILAGPVTGLIDPQRDFGALTGPLISLAVAVILFEGGLSLDRHRLGDAKAGVMRLVFIGAPLGWLVSTLALRLTMNLSWETSAVFGGIMIVTGPTVIAPLLRSARLKKRPAQLLQWEAIVNDPIGALAAVFAFEVVLVLNTGVAPQQAVTQLAIGIVFAAIIGLAAGFAIATSFRKGFVPEYMKIPVLFVTLLICFALADTLLHESGLLAVTVMGLVIGNADLPSYTELRRFKEHATILLVSGVFILLAASLDLEQLSRLDWHAIVFVLVVVILARPATVMISLLGVDMPWREKLFIALTGPRGVVLVAVAGLFGQHLADAGISDGAVIGPLAFILVTATVVLHGFTLAPLGRLLGLAGTEKPGLLIVGGSRFTTQLGEILKQAEVPVLVTDPNHAHLIRPRAAGLRTFYGDILGEAAEDSVELMAYSTVLAATDNDAYNTLVATDLGAELGRNQVWQIARQKEDRKRHSLPTQLGGRPFGDGRTFEVFREMVREGWTFRITRLTDEFTIEDWRVKRPTAVPILRITPASELRFVDKAEELKAAPGAKIVSLLPPDALEDENKHAARQPVEDPETIPGPSAKIP
ncbi:sodium:proton exchanger [Thioclava sp. SK-1]|uniref:cation:proton antiporter n=1 Tax=Thioclava sp. SK-1 TaxID=1889770 RepID=UPI0008257936|nr:sodium:proton antiporter [Thioclava sp. SK-1]OCX60970.1 sodium:proton exchanger [Thioclava sp. SK-1]